VERGGCGRISGTSPPFAWRDWGKPQTPHSECSLSSNRDAPLLSPRHSRCVTLPPTRHDTRKLQSRQLPCYERCVLHTISIHATGHTAADSRHAYTNKSPPPRQPLSEMWEPLFPAPTASLRDRFRLTYVSFTAARKKKNLTSPTHLQNLVSGKLHGMRLVVYLHVDRLWIHLPDCKQCVFSGSFVCRQSERQFGMSLLITLCRHLLRYTAAYRILMQVI
jgi:hypothetical protein